MAIHCPGNHQQNIWAIDWLTDKINGISDDVIEKRARYVQRNCEILQEFTYAHPELTCKLNRIFNSSFCGSVLWDLSSENVNSLIYTWSVSVRHMWNLPLQTHRYLIEPLGGTHLKMMLYTRFENFIDSIKNGKKLAAKYLLELIKDNTETITGRNIKTINNDTKNLEFEPCPVKEKWRINQIKELVEVKQKNLFVVFDDGEELSEENIDDMLDYIAIT